MTIDEIEARWKAATPGPWRYNGLVGEITVSQVPPMRAIVRIPRNDADVAFVINAPTDIAYLLDRVRMLACDLEWQAAVTRAYAERMEVLAPEHDKLKRAHAWLVTKTDEGTGQCLGCLRYDGESHDDDCEWVKAKELRL